MPILLPDGLANHRTALIAEMTRREIGVRHYFSPHLAQQPYFASVSEAGDLTATRDVADRILSLPMSDAMTEAEVLIVCNALHQAIEQIA